jgi:hypothetical protein
MRRAGAFLLFFLSVGSAVGCATEATEEEDDDGSTEAAQTEVGGEGVVYFHGMSKLGFTRDALRGGLGTTSFLAPSLSDSALQSRAPLPAAVTFFDKKDTGTVAGYSLGRAPVITMMKAQTAKMKHAVLIDPTYDSYAAFGRGVGGAITKEWLDGSEERTFLLVYGDVTKQLGGEKSFVDALADHPRAHLCYLRGDHARFRQADMTAAIQAADCADLDERLAR